AKYFYQNLGERGVEQPFLQPITYLAYTEILKKENLLLFKEEFQAGLACPVLLSLRDLIKKHGNHLDYFFSQVPDITDYRVLSHLEKLAKKYAEAFACEIQYKAQDSRSSLTNCLSSHKLRSVFAFTNKAFKEYSVYTLSEVKEIDNHFHYINEKDKKNLTELCQMSLGEEEGRMVGVLEKINSSQKHPERNFLFSPVFYDFEHSFHPNLRKKKLKT
ncbi:7238_t:CDS:2, partial [Funneliformis geosporum]